MDLEEGSSVLLEHEEGELSDDSDVGYIPLARPDNYSNLGHVAKVEPNEVVADESSSDQNTSDSNSDSDNPLASSTKAKRPKIKLKAQKKLLPKKKRFDIWSTRVQEDVLSETLNSCDVTQKDRSRDVESYDYVAARELRDKIGRFKRTRDDRKNIKLRLGKREDDGDEETLKGNSRYIQDVSTTLDNSVEEIAADISNKLCEEKDDLILKVLNIVGKGKCFEIFKRTQEIEADGGMLIMNQTRRRTPGGVFLFLIRQDDSISEEQKKLMFREDTSVYRKQMKEKRKKKLEKLKQQTAQERVELLPDLLKRAEKYIEHKQVKHEHDVDVTNPPPTPETDGHENSDGNDNNFNPLNEMKMERNERRLNTSYEEDFLDIACSNNDMDLF